MSKKSFEEIVSSMKEIVAASSQVVVSKVDTLEAKVDNNHKEVMARLASIEEHIIQPVQKCGAPKTVNTVQYNGIADQLQPMGKCIYRGKEVNYFGICSKCGQPIIQPSSVAYCMANKLDITCYTCQKGGAHKFKAEFLPGDPNANGKAPAPTTAPEKEQDLSTTTNCEICGKPRRYKSALDFIEKTKEAEKHGFPKVMCSACARAKVAEMKNNTSAPTQPSFVTFDELLHACELDIALNAGYMTVVDAMKQYGSESEDITPVKKAFYKSVKDVAKNIQDKAQKTVSKDDLTKVYGTYINRAKQDAYLEDKDTAVKMSVKEVIAYLLETSNLTPDKIKALTIAKLKEVLLGDDVELGFTGMDWNRGKRAAVDEVVSESTQDDAQQEEEAPVQDTHVKEEAPVTTQSSEDIKADLNEDGNIGF